MSIFFGIFNRDGAPVAPELVSNLHTSMSCRQPDDSGEWISGVVAFGHEMIWNTPESKYEQLPLVKDSIVITMNARIDNRDELYDILELPDTPLEEMGDSEFILAAYNKWGEDCPAHLLGDFAFAIWDGHKQEIFCARDHSGIKQLYYYLDDKLFLFGNDLRGLTTFPGIDTSLSDEALANFVGYHELRSNTLTFFSAFKKLPPAHFMIITAQNMRQSCYWRLEDAPRVILESFEQYSMKLRELLECAVSDRMRTAYPLTSHLSGGVDSSSIAVIAARKLCKDGKKLLAFNWLHPPGKEDDPRYYEWYNSKAIADKEGIEHHYIDLNIEQLASYFDEHEIWYGDTISFLYESVVRETVESKGGRTILSGWGGDDVVSYHGGSFIVDLVFQGKYRKAIKALRQHIVRSSRAFPFAVLAAVYRHIFLSMVPRRFYCQLPLAQCSAGEPAYDLMAEEFATIVKKNFKDRYIFVGQFCRTIRKDMLYSYNNGHISTRIESWETGGLTQGIEYCYPLLDKRLLEFAVGIPGEFFEKNGTRRYILKKAIEDLIPSSILWQSTKREPQRVRRLLNFVPEFSERIRKSLEFNGSVHFINISRLNKELDILKRYNINIKQFTDESELRKKILDIDCLYRLCLSLTNRYDAKIRNYSRG